MTEIEQNTTASNTPAYTEKQRYMDALPGIGTVALVVFGIMDMDKCGDIPTLAWYCIVFGGLQVLMTAFKFAFRIPMSPALQKDDVPTKVSGLLGLLAIASAIWGAVISFPNAGAMFAGDLDCSSQLFYSGFISSALPLVFVVGFAGYAIMQKMRG